VHFISLKFPFTVKIFAHIQASFVVVQDQIVQQLRKDLESAAKEITYLRQDDVGQPTFLTI
jgi:hypothetical protein